MNVHDSMERIMQSQDGFGEAFYEVFFRRCPEAQPYFKDSDMKRQALVLTMAVSLIEQYDSRGYPATGKYLQHLGAQHHGRSIPRELYPVWRDAMLETLGRFIGDDWTEELSAQWSEAIDRCSRVMFQGYERRVTL